MTTPKDGTRKPTEDVAVTEVSESVLAELSDIFGTKKAESMSSAEDETPTNVLPADDATSESVEIVEAMTTSETVIIEDVVDVAVESDAAGDFDSGDIVFSDDTALTPGPVDPLLRPLSLHGDVISIVDEDDGTVVIDADQVDRVVIVDDDRPDSTFEERRRRRERRERLKKVKWLKLAGVLVGVIVFVMAVLASPLFAIRRVVFEGNVYTSQTTIESVRQALDGASTFTVDTAKARARLLRDPWVADVRITTQFPGKALVEISERVPVVWYVGDDEKARIVDARGHVIAVLDGWPTKYLRVIGVGPSLEAGAVADDAYRAAAQLVLALPDEIRPLVKSLELSAGGELSMVLKGNTIVRFGPPTDLQRKLVAVVVLLRRQDPATLAVVDVSTGEPTVQTR